MDVFTTAVVRMVITRVQAVLLALNTPPPHASLQADQSLNSPSHTGPLNTALHMCQYTAPHTGQYMALDIPHMGQYTALNTAPHMGQYKDLITAQALLNPVRSVPPRL